VSDTKKVVAKGKALLKSKTFYFNALVVLTAVAGMFGFEEFEMEPEHLELLTAVIGVGNIVLRLKTKEKIDRIK
jgi:hypothetical protein